MNNEIIVVDNQQIHDLIYTIRGVQVMIDRDIAKLYGVETRRLNEQVKRNIVRFPEKFRFQLTIKEFDYLKSQIQVSSSSFLRSQFATLKRREKLLWCTHAFHKRL